MKVPLQWPLYINTVGNIIERFLLRFFSCLKTLRRIKTNNERKSTENAEELHVYLLIAIPSQPSVNKTSARERA